MRLLSGWVREKRISRVGEYLHGDVLEVGCGHAITYELYQDKIDSYYGIEMAEERVQVLKEKFPGAHFYKRDLDNDQLKLSKQFDTILSVAVIEHIFNQKFAFNELVKYLKPGGRIVITTPTPLGNDVVHKIASRTGLLSKSAHDDHIIIFNKQRFEILAKEFDMKIESYKKFQFGCNQLVVMKKRP